MTHFDILPPNVNYTIGSYIDYNSRIEFSRVLGDRDEKYVRKLDSRNHESFIHMKNISIMTERMAYIETNNDAALYLTKIYNYILNMKNNDLFNDINLREALIVNSNVYTNEYFSGHDKVYGNVKKNLVNTSIKLKTYLEKYEQKLNCNINPKLISIT